MYTRFLFISIFFSFFGMVHGVSALTGAISSPSQAQVCHDATCTFPTPGIINWKPTGVTAVVIDSITGLSGMIWGNELGWINLQPTGEGVTFANATTGLLTGRAWSQVSGWINFAPTGQSVTINPSTGKFSGYAWTGGPNGGWIKFDCNTVASCVQTTWMTSSGGGGGGGGGGVVLPPLPAPIDICPNLEGSQSTLPSGYTIDGNGQCVSIVDVCPNLDGIQSQVPFEFTINVIGACIPATVDYCPNILGNQTEIPNNRIIDENGLCISIPIDVCPDTSGIQSSISQCAPNENDACTNLQGVQSFVPEGYVQQEKECFLSTLDICKNISGNQQTIPDGMILDEESNCITEPNDLCTNLPGYQEIVPKQFREKDNVCTFVEGSTEEIPKADDSTKVIAFPFIPKIVQVPTGNPVIKKFVENVDELLGTDLTKTPYKVDTVSGGVLGLTLFLGVRIILLIIRRLRP